MKTYRLQANQLTAEHFDHLGYAVTDLSEDGKRADSIVCPACGHKTPAVFDRGDIPIVEGKGVCASCFYTEAIIDLCEIDVRSIGWELYYEALENATRRHKGEEV